MKHSSAGAVLAAFIATAALLDAQSHQRALTVFVTAAPAAKPDNESQKQYEAAFAEAVNKQKELEKTLKAQHGNKRESWPADVQELYRNVEEAAALAKVRSLYANASPEHLTDSVEDLRRGLTGAGLRSRKENVILVETPDEAQLIVELRARRDRRSAGRGLIDGLAGGDYFVLFVIKPGPKLGAEQFAAIPRTYRHQALLTRPQPGAPEWMFEAVGKGSWKVAGSVASSIVEHFIEKNYDALTKASGSR